MALDTDFVWRMESREGVGPYRGSDVINDETEGVYNYSQERHPLPWLDGIPSEADSRHVCGFDSIKQARDWWYESRDADHFDSTGMILAAWRKADLESVFYGGHQAMFIRPQDQSKRAAILIHLLWESDEDELANLAKSLISH